MINSLRRVHTEYLELSSESSVKAWTATVSRRFSSMNLMLIFNDVNNPRECYNPEHPQDPIHYSISVILGGLGRGSTLLRIAVRMLCSQYN